jgi:nucleoside-diphosphate-sugar epimerase
VSSRIYRHVFRRRVLKAILKIAIDAAVAAAALLAAFALRFDGSIPAPYAMDLAWLVGFVAVAKTTVNFALRAHSRMWQYVSMREAVVLATAAAASTAGLLLLSLAGLLDVPISVLLIDGALYLLGAAGVRVLRRAQVTFVKKRSGVSGDGRVRTLLIGAGDTANALLGDMENRNHTVWDIVGLLDDSPSKQGAKLRGHPVLGPTSQLESLIQRENVKHVVVAMPSANRMVLRNLIGRAQTRGATVQAVPALEDLLRNGKGSVGRLPVTLEDLVDSGEVKRTLLSRVRRRVPEPCILVTGGAGYIGSHVVARLLERGCRVRVLDNFMYGRTGLERLRGHPNLEVKDGDISSIRDVVSAVKDVEAVIALAAIVGDPACGINAEETLNLNYESTKVLVEACNFYGVQRLVFASSCSVYGASDNIYLTEQSALNPVSLYARTRIMSEEVILERCGDVTAVILRLSTVFGLSARMRFDLVVNALTARALVDRRIQIFGGGQWRPFVHCADAAEAFVLAATALPELVRRETFNVGGAGMNHTIGQVGEMIADEVGDDVRIEYVDAMDDPRNYRVTFDKITQHLGFTPNYDLRSGIREMIVALEQNPALRDYNQAAYSNVKVLRDRFESADAQIEVVQPAVR